MSPQSRFFLILFFIGLGASNATAIDVLRYKAVIEPDLANKSLKGEVEIFFREDNPEATEFVFGCGDLEIDKVLSQGKDVAFTLKGKKVRGQLNLLLEAGGVYSVKINYHGAPKRGVKFFDGLMYTAYSTQNWMVCSKNLVDKSSLDLTLIVPEAYSVVGNGQRKLVKSLAGGMSHHQWVEESYIPAYTMGFVITNSAIVTEQHRNITLNYIGPKYTEEQLETIFKEMPGMVDFFEERSGIALPGSVYTQAILPGNVSQEMEDFCVLWEGYGDQVLANEDQINLSAHELCHQWWGNHVSCVNWNHFWLNEGLVVFMSSAYKQHRFGDKIYQEDIAFYKGKYESVEDKSLVFPDWKSPTGADRVIVYFKGAYVFHLMREELGDELFWKGLKHYTQYHYGEYVESKDLHHAMETATGRDLDAFFAEWVY